MSTDFASIRNIHEAPIFETVLALRGDYPGVAEALLPDVACVALNRLPPRYIRHSVDLAFYQSEKEREDLAQLQLQAVHHAYAFVQARTAMRARG